MSQAHRIRLRVIVDKKDWQLWRPPSVVACGLDHAILQPDGESVKSAVPVFGLVVITTLLVNHEAEEFWVLSLRYEVGILVVGSGAAGRLRFPWNQCRCISKPKRGVEPKVSPHVEESD
jgi:hypothetical protein